MDRKQMHDRINELEMALINTVESYLYLVKRDDRGEFSLPEVYGGEKRSNEIMDIYMSAIRNQLLPDTLPGE